MTTPAPRGRLLIADDEQTILDLLAASLRFAGFEVVTATDGRDALTAARRERPDAMVLDVMMPGMDGFELVRRLRAEGQDAPVLFLTARDATEDKVRGLSVGADDYVTKPFSLEEVIARLEALLRRSGRQAATLPSRLSVGDVDLDEDRHEVRKAGELVELTPTEFNLLRLFLANPDRVLSKSTILDRVWHYDFEGESGIVESYVSYLRRKIDTTEPRMLHTVRGFGYVLRTPGS
ncbi:MAG: response regulator transcription factor [Candidatus Nanopelagicales bacterium]